MAPPDPVPTREGSRWPWLARALSSMSAELRPPALLVRALVAELEPADDRRTRS
jgi:hypothetical protein